MKQRVAIARALVESPDFIMMDEPFAALDFQTRVLMQRFLLEVWLEFKPTIIFVTHHIDEAVLLADRVVVMSAGPGRIIEEVRIDLPRPRRMTDPGFNDYRARLTETLEREVMRALCRGRARGRVPMPRDARAARARLRRPVRPSRHRRSALQRSRARRCPAATSRSKASSRTRTARAPPCCWSTSPASVPIARRLRPPSSRFRRAAVPAGGRGPSGARRRPARLWLSHRRRRSLDAADRGAAVFPAWRRAREAAHPWRPPADGRPARRRARRSPDRRRHDRGRAAAGRKRHGRRQARSTPPTGC